MILLILSLLIGTALASIQYCESDKNCTKGEQYCAASECLDYSACKEDVDCYNPSNVFNTIQCLGYLSCENKVSKKGVCEKTCQDACKDGSQVINCFVSPCTVNKCDGAFQCIDDYCGGCNSIHLDKAGKEICRNSTEQCPARECNNYLKKRINNLNKEIKKLKKVNEDQQKDIKKLKDAVFE